MAEKMDPAHAETEAILKNLESRIKKEYQIATKEMEDKISDYMSRFTLKDQKWQEWVSDGTKTADQYKQWRQQQMMVGKSYESLKDTLADEMVNADKVAKTMIRNTMPAVYAENFNFGVYETEMAAKVDTSFTLYNKDAIARLLQDDPDFIPPMGKQTKKAVSEGKVKAWNKQQVQSVMTQGILQGESIPKLSKRLATTVGERNYKSAIRNARTMTTGVENAGRMDAYKRQEALGIDLQVEWRSVLDNRTRHEHRQLDGQKRPVGEPFEVHGIKIEYGGDPHAPANMIYNCRCTINAVYEGLEPRARKYREIEGGQTYDEWKKGKAKSNPIDLQEQKGKVIAGKYRNEYKQSSSVLNKNDENSIINTKLMNTKVKDGEPINPMSEEVYNRMKAGLERNGIKVIQAVGDDERYLIQGLGAEASYSHGYIMHLGKVPSASAMFEETIHSTQAKIYGELDSSEPIELYAREVAANRMLKRNAKAYGFDQIDIDDINANLEMWEKKFERLVGKTYDESDYKREI